MSAGPTQRYRIIIDKTSRAFLLSSSTFFNGYACSRRHILVSNTVVSAVLLDVSWRVHVREPEKSVVFKVEKMQVTEHHIA